MRLALDVVGALHDTFRGALPGVLVLDGQPAQVPSVPDALVVGFQTEGAPSASAATTPAGLTVGEVSTTVTVTCMLSCWGGSEPFARLRERASGLLDEVEKALAADRSLGGLVDTAEVDTSGDVFQATSEDGSELVVAFAVRCERL